MGDAPLDPLCVSFSRCVVESRCRGCVVVGLRNALSRVLCLIFFVFLSRQGQQITSTRTATIMATADATSSRHTCTMQTVTNRIEARWAVTRQRVFAMGGGGKTVASGRGLCQGMGLCVGFLGCGGRNNSAVAAGFGGDKKGLTFFVVSFFSPLPFLFPSSLGRTCCSLVSPLVFFTSQVWLRPANGKLRATDRGRKKGPKCAGTGRCSAQGEMGLRKALETLF